MVLVLTDALRSRYPYTLIYPLSNGYGLALFSRLELVDNNPFFD